MSRKKSSAISYQLSDKKQGFIQHHLCIMSRFMKSGAGFTLIELLVTISIIAILSAIGMVAYSDVLKQGRDFKRQSDLKAIQTALEMYYIDQGFYPAASPSPLASGQPLTNSTGNPVSVTVTKTYMKSLPQDPNGSTPYEYKEWAVLCDNASGGICTSYCLFAKLESLSSPNIPDVCSSYNPDSIIIKYNFALTPP